jgi:hypothetical protein
MNNAIIKLNSSKVVSLLSYKYGVSSYKLLPSKIGSVSVRTVESDKLVSDELVSGELVSGELKKITKK